MEKTFAWLFEKPKRFFLLLILASLFLRISGFSQTFLDIDESQFAGFAHVLMDGGLPYMDSLDTKPPLIYLFYALCFSIFGRYSMWGVHLMGVFVAFGVALTLYKIARDHASQRAGFFAALFYILFSTTHVPKFTSASITSIMVLPLA